LVIYTFGSGLGQSRVAFGQEPLQNSQHKRASKGYSFEEAKRLQLEEELKFLVDYISELVL
jgi:hypothetical protein